MRPEENIEKFVRVGKPKVTTGPQMDERTLQDSFAAMEQTIRSRATDHRPGAAGIIIRNRMIKLAAAAAVIIVGIGLFAVLFQRGPSERISPRAVESSPGMMSAISLKMAYRRGGMQALDEQCEDALKKLGPRMLRLTLGQLLTENNG